VWTRREAIKIIGASVSSVIAAPLMDWTVVEPVQGDGVDVIQDAIDSAPAGSTVVLQGEFTVSDYIILKSNITIDGLGSAKVEGTVDRTGTNYGIFYTTDDLSNAKIRGMRLIRKAGGMGGVVAFNGDPSYKYTGCGIYGCDCYSENAGCFPYSCGDGMEAVGCTFRGSELVNSNAVEIGYAGQPRFYDCTIIGGSGPDYTYGLLFTDNGGGLFSGCHVEGRTYGAMVTAGANPRFVGCEFMAINGVPVTVQAVASPLFEACTIQSKVYSALYTYDSADDGEIAPIVPHVVPYRVYSMHVRVDTAQPGKTLDIGRTSGGSEIAANVDLSTTGFKGIVPPWAVKFYANDPIYLTPSAAITDGCLRIMYSVIVDTNNVAVYATTAAGARFVNCYILGLPGGVYLTDDGAEFVKCTIECPDESKYAINYSTPSVAKFYDCLYRGAVRNVSEWDTY
jgi:hypothetical protein